MSIRSASIEVRITSELNDGADMAAIQPVRAGSESRACVKMSMILTMIDGDGRECTVVEHALTAVRAARP